MVLQYGKRIVDFVHINRNECSLLERIEIFIALFWNCKSLTSGLTIE